VFDESSKRQIAWIHGSVYLAFPEEEARGRVLFDLVQQFSKIDPEDLEWLRYKLSVVECHALDMARGLELRGTGTVQTPRRDPWDCRLRCHSDKGDRRRGRSNDPATSEECPGQSLYFRCRGGHPQVLHKEARQQFAGGIRTIIESSLVQSLPTSQELINE
jgi:hypothetical protein